jgi:hypothetical protein
VLGLLVVEVAGAAVALFIGVPWPTLLIWAGPLIAFTLATLSPTMGELARRKPRLTVTTQTGARLVARSRPWPIDAERILANELADARETAKRRHHALDNFTFGGAFGGPPSETEHDRAQVAFEKDVVDYDEKLSTWLTNYSKAAREYADTFEMIVRLENGVSGAYADTVAVVLELPSGVTAIDGLPEVPAPPERPSYEPPRPQSSLGPFARRERFPIVMPDRSVMRARPAGLLRKTLWKQSEDGRRLEATVGDIHPGRSVEVDEALFLRASAPGSYSVRWIAYSKSARQPASGAFDLEVPLDDPSRPRFGRLNGIVSYPDVPLIDGDGEIRDVRSGDPPARPSSSERSDAEPLAAIRDAHRLLVWRGLGLDPADDGPEEAVEIAGAPDRGRVHGDRRDLHRAYFSPEGGQ